MIGLVLAHIAEIIILIKWNTITSVYVHRIGQWICQATVIVWTHVGVYVFCLITSYRVHPQTPQGHEELL